MVKISFSTVEIYFNCNIRYQAFIPLTRCVNVLNWNSCNLSKSKTSPFSFPILFLSLTQALHIGYYHPSSSCSALYYTHCILYYIFLVSFVPSETYSCFDFFFSNTYFLQLIIIKTIFSPPQMLLFYFSSVSLNGKLNWFMERMIKWILIKEIFPCFEAITRFFFVYKYIRLNLSRSFWK